MLALANPQDHLAPLGRSPELAYDVARQLRARGSVLVAQLWEQWPQPLDAQLSNHGGVVLRSQREDGVPAGIEGERAALEGQRAYLERLRSRGDPVDARITAVEDGLRELRDRARAALAAAAAEHDAKMDVLTAKRALGRGPARTRLDVRISERLAEHRHRTMTLMRAAN